MTTLSEAREAIYNRFDTLWTRSEPFTLDNEEYTPPDNYWLRLTVRHTANAQRTMGPKPSRKFSRKGRIIIDVFAPRDDATATADILSKTAADIFEGESFSGIDVFEADIKELGIDPHGWYQQQVEAFFDYEEIK